MCEALHVLVHEVHDLRLGPLEGLAHLLGQVLAELLLRFFDTDLHEAQDILAHRRGQPSLVVLRTLIHGARPRVELMAEWVADELGLGLQGWGELGQGADARRGWLLREVRVWIRVVLRGPSRVASPARLLRLTPAASMVPETPSQAVFQPPCTCQKNGALVHGAREVGTVDTVIRGKPLLPRADLSH